MDGALEMNTESLQRWARTYRSIGSAGKAELLESAVVKIEAGETDAALGAELLACALASEQQPEQESAAALMRDAAERLVSP